MDRSVNELVDIAKQFSDTMEEMKLPTRDQLVVSFMLMQATNGIMTGSVIIETLRELKGVG